MKTKQNPNGRTEPGSFVRDVDVSLLSLISSGCTLDEIVEILGLPLGEVHRRLVKLRLVIEDVSRATSNH